MKNTISTCGGEAIRIRIGRAIYIYKMLTDYQLQNNCDFTPMSDSDKLKLLLNTSVKTVARFIMQICNIRTQTLSRRN